MLRVARATYVFDPRGRILYLTVLLRLDMCRLRGQG